MKSFYLLLTMFGLCSVFYYLGDITGWQWLNTVHDFHRTLFLLPIVYTAYVFGTRAVLIISLLTLMVFIPRAIFISPYPDAAFRALFFGVVAGGVGYLIARLRE